MADNKWRLLLTYITAQKLMHQDLLVPGQKGKNLSVLKEMHLGGNFDRPLQEKYGLFFLVLYSRQYFVLLSNNLRYFFVFFFSA